MLSKVVYAFVSLMILGGSPCSAASAQRSLPTLITRRVQRDLSQRLNVPSHTLEIKAASEITWPDQCLGIRYSRTENCGIHDVEGWQITVESEQQTWVYRSDRIARRLRLEPLSKATESATANFSTQTSQKLITAAAQQLQQPMENLSILAVRSMERATCSESGLSTNSENCQTEITPGFQVLVAEGSRDWPMVVVDGYDKPLPGNQFIELVEAGPKEWVYELDEDGGRIVQNAIASDAIGKVATYFASERRAGTLLEPPEGEPEVIFQSVYDSSNRETITLTADGTVFFEQESRYPEETIKREPMYTISLEKVAAFEALLERQQFSRFNRLIYANEDRGLATEGIVKLISEDGSVFLNADDQYLPSNLQPIVEAWTFLYRDL